MYLALSDAQRIRLTASIILSLLGKKSYTKTWLKKRTREQFIKSEEKRTEKASDKPISIFDRENKHLCRTYHPNTMFLDIDFDTAITLLETQGYIKYDGSRVLLR